MELRFDPKLGIWAEEPETVEKLQKNYFGRPKGGKVWLDIEEALYLINLQNAVCMKGDQEICFNVLARHYIPKEPRLFVRYNAYRDWRDRGLIVKRIEEVKGKIIKVYKRYPAKTLEVRKLATTALWYSDSLYSLLEDETIGRALFSDYWIGQWGIYKQERGKYLKLDFMETLFLAKYFGLIVIDGKTGRKLTPARLLSQVKKSVEFAKQLYEVYEDWRLKGFIVKTGFKFGSHFRIYFPGASPLKEEYVHSKHVLHVFPKEQKLLISEWARAVRVAHGVKKTFILAIPEMRPKDYIEYPADFLAYRRKKQDGIWVRENPEEDRPRYLLTAVAEDEYIGGIELASLLKRAKDMGLELILSITDRETAITYYVLKRIILPGSGYEYYEIEWMKP